MIAPRTGLLTVIVVDVSCLHPAGTRGPASARHLRNPAYRRYPDGVSDAWASWMRVRAGGF